MENKNKFKTAIVSLLKQRMYVYWYMYSKAFYVQQK